MHTPSSHPRRLPVTAALALSGMLLAACGGGGADPAPGPVNPPAPAGPSEIVLLAGSPTESGLTDGSGAAARFGEITPMLAIDAAGNVYVAQLRSVRKISRDGVVTTLAGNGEGGTADGQGSAARFMSLEGIAVDAAGNVYVSDSIACASLCSLPGEPSYVSSHTIRKISPGGMVTTLAGSPDREGFADGAGAAASFFLPSGIAAQADGTLYVADCGNRALRKISPAGTVSTVARADVCMANGVSIRTSPSKPSGVALGADGSVFVASSRDNAIRKITPDGSVTRIAAATAFNEPIGIGADGSGNLFVADAGNHVVRKIAADGSVTTLAGAVGVPGTVLGKLPGGLSRPQGLALGQAGAVVVNSGSAIVTIR